MFFSKENVPFANGKSRVENAITSISCVQCTPVGMYQKNFGKRLAINFSVDAFCLAKLDARPRRLFSRCGVRTRETSRLVRPSANLSSYTTILVYYLYIYISNLLYLTIIVLYLVNRQTRYRST